MLIPRWLLVRLGNHRGGNPFERSKILWCLVGETVVLGPNYRVAWGLPLSLYTKPQPFELTAWSGNPEASLW